MQHQGCSQPHSPEWARVPLSLFFPQNFDQFFLFLKLYLFSSSFWPSGWVSSRPGKALATPLRSTRWGLNNHKLRWSSLSLMSKHHHSCFTDFTMRSCCHVTLWISICMPQILSERLNLKRSIAYSFAHACHNANRPIYLKVHLYYHCIALLAFPCCTYCSDCGVTAWQLRNQVQFILTLDVSDCVLFLLRQMVIDIISAPEDKATLVWMDLYGNGQKPAAIAKGGVTIAAPGSMPLCVTTYTATYVW